jgi:adenylate cyclase
MPSVCPHCRASLPSPTPPPICPFCHRTILAAVGQAKGSEARVVIRSPDGTSTEAKLGERTRIGRHPVNPIKLADREVSKEHAEISRVGADWWIQDLNSSNGTFVNGRRVTRFKLKDGDEIALGGTVLVFKTSVTAPQAPSGAGVTMIQAVGTHVLASLRAEDPEQSQTGFKPEKDVQDIADLRRDYEKLRIANEFHRQVGLERDLKTVYDKILKVAFDLLSVVDNGVILVRKPDSDEMSIDAVRRRKGGEVLLSQTLIDQVVKTHEGVLTQDAIVDSRFSSAASIVAQGIRSAMAVPLLSKNQLRGVLYVDTRERVGAFTEKDLRVLAGIAAQAAVAIENAELARRIEQEAETRAHLSRFLSPALVEQAQKGQLDLKKGGELREVSVLFADIRGFTSMTEKSEPQEIVTLLNEYFEAMVDEVFEHGGVLDKFIGDCIMAMWGAPVRRDDDAARALRCAVGMQEALRVYNRQRQELGRHPLAMGIGVNTGEAVVGNMGSSKRLEYTCIGDAVNLASRLCSMAKPGQVVISAATLEKGGDGFEVRALPPTKVKGKEHPVPVFEVLGFLPETAVKP